MIVVNYDNVKYVYVSDVAKDGVTLHFTDGGDMPLFGDDAVKVKNDLRLFINTTDRWRKVSFSEGD
jgi:hypothetical protein